MSDVRLIKDKKGRFIKGNHYSSSTEFKKGKSSPRKGKKRPGWKNQTSFKSRENLWKNDVQEYQSLHAWIKKEKGQPNICDVCKRTDLKSTQYHWSNISRKYLKDITDWQRLCFRCHKDYDHRLVGISRAGNIILNSYFMGGMTLICGNGGSLSESDHFSSELLGKFEKKRVGIPSVSFSSGVVMSAIANDFGFEYVFSRQVEAFSNKNNILICLTTSDYDEKNNHNSNLWEAVKMAKKKKIKIIILGSHKTKRLAQFANCIIRGTGMETAEIQNDHLRLIHLICRYIDKKL